MSDKPPEKKAQAVADQVKLELGQETDRERINRVTRELASGKLRPPAAKSRGKPVPTKYAHLIKAEWFRRFTMLDRLKIALGCNLVVMIGIATEKNPVSHQPLILGRVSRQKSATEHMRNVVENMLEDSKAATSPEARSAEDNIVRLKQDNKP